jgi:hypothetical protein
MKSNLAGGAAFKIAFEVALTGLTPRGSVRRFSGVGVENHPRRKEAGMSKIVRAAMAALGLAGALVASGVLAADGPGVEAKAAFERLKALAGEWEGEAEGDHQPDRVLYRVTANGTAVMETLFPGTNHEMVSMYFRDGDDLRMTHYCAMGNQPHLKLDRQASSSDELKFIFDGGTNLDPEKDNHVHSARFRFRDVGRLEAEWEGYAGGKKAHTKTIVASRKKVADSGR